MARKKGSFFKKITRKLYKWAKISNDIDSLMTGDPIKIGKRLMNKRIGRTVSRRINFR